MIKAGSRSPPSSSAHAIVAVHDRGYAEVTLEPNQQPGELTLKDWAHIEGRLLQAGQPVAGVSVSFRPLRLRGGVSPHIQDQISVKTDRAGHFVFPSVPPLKASVRAQVSVWRDSPLTSGQSVPLDLRPGEHVVLDLGGKGTVVKGRVMTLRRRGFEDRSSQIAQLAAPQGARHRAAGEGSGAGAHR